MRLSFIVIFIFILMSCSKDDTITSVENDYLDFSKYFPLKIENRWYYESESPGEWGIVERTIVDTIRDSDENLLFKAKWGIENYPNDEYTAEYYYWGESGLYKYYCGIEDTCKDQSGNELPPIFELLIKSPSFNGENWDRYPEWTMLINNVEINMQDSLKIYNEVGSTACDTVFHDVIVISYTSSVDNKIKTHEYYAPNFGLIASATISENDTIYHLELLKYNIY